MAFRDRSKPRRISPYPITPGGTVEETQPAVEPATPPRVVAEKPKPPRKAEKPKVEPPPQEMAEEVPTTVGGEVGTDELPVAKVLDPPTETSHLYDIELCIVGSMTAAQREVNRMPKEMKDKVQLQRDPRNGQVHVILCTAGSRSHVVRTQAMLIDEYPDSCLIPHQ